MREEQHHIYVAQTSNNRGIMACDLYCCLLPQCEALRAFRSQYWKSPPPCKVLPSICMMPAAHESTQHLPRSCVLAPWLKSYALISASFEACSSVKQTSHRDQFRSFENNPNGLPTPGTARIDRSSVCDTAVALRLRLYVFVWLIFYDINLCAPIADRANHRKCIRPNLTRDRRRATPIQL